jgi:uncharacterized protein YajQ (UPF0234 family)
MADTSSFDIVSDVNLQEVDNAVNQSRKEMAQRFDFKGSKSSIELQQKEGTLTILADDEFRLKAVLDILQGKLIRRAVPVKALSYGAIEPAASGMVRQIITLQRGISKEQARKLIQLIKATKLKVQAQIMEDQLRVSGRSKDDLQAVMAMVRKADLAFAVQFTNYR